MEQAFLSNIELYYSSDFSESSTNILLLGEELLHALKVMRHKKEDILYVTNGKGIIAKTIIRDISSKNAFLNVEKIIKYKSPFVNISFFIPNLKNSDRLEFSIEKCTELGVTDLTVYNSDRSIQKGCKLERLNKIIIAAMKQSLRANLPKLQFNEQLINTNFDSEIIILDQSSKTDFLDYFNNISLDKTYTIIIGPEGGFSEREYDLLASGTKLNIAPNRLRSETACITCASLLNFIKLAQ
ncbi:MAG TPA: RsmE family RNA methyltransferase [Melioribacteraceae bacterium]|nr:RsmE family RNA methyltransferase [Melioribacteraceae bacterium]